MDLDFLRNQTEDRSIPRLIVCQAKRIRFLRIAATLTIRQWFSYSLSLLFILFLLLHEAWFRASCICSCVSLSSQTFPNACVSLFCSLWSWLGCLLSTSAGSFCKRINASSNYFSKVWLNSYITELIFDLLNELDFLLDWVLCRLLLLDTLGRLGELGGSSLF